MCEMVSYIASLAEEDGSGHGTTAVCCWPVNVPGACVEPGPGAVGASLECAHQRRWLSACVSSTMARALASCGITYCRSISNPGVELKRSGWHPECAAELEYAPPPAKCGCSYC